MERLMGHAPHILDPWIKLEDAFFASKTFLSCASGAGTRTLALSTGCRYCQAKGGPPDRTHADSRTAAAVELAEHFARDHRSIDEAVLARARDHFGGCGAMRAHHVHGLHVAGGTFGAVVGDRARSASAVLTAIDDNAHRKDIRQMRGRTSIDQSRQEGGGLRPTSF